jgi:hypothetical protein
MKDFDEKSALVGAVGGITALLIAKYGIFGEARWNEILTPLHRRLPNNIPDSRGNP